MHQAQPLKRGHADMTDDRTHTRHDTERVRQAARVLLDAGAGYDPAASDEVNAAAMGRASVELSHVPMSVASGSDGRIVVSVDLAHLIAGSLFVVSVLLAHAAEISGQTREEIADHMREAIGDPDPGRPWPSP
jgi:hypothetical protein